MVRSKVVLLLMLVFFMGGVLAIPQMFNVYGNATLSQVVGCWLLVVGRGVKPLASRLGGGCYEE